LRTTLAHELAHVVFHNFIWWFDQGALDAPTALALSPRCHRRVSVGTADWMEWQANYASGALLMPRTALASLFPTPEAVWLRASRGRERVSEVQKRCVVSAHAAQTRLLQMGMLTQRPTHVARSPVPRALLKRP
jgi:Zn-dependent peptidase ImmA (M78 family)